jgi:hypothetical protein
VNWKLLVNRWRNESSPRYQLGHHPAFTKSVMSTGSTPHRMKMVRWSVLSSRSLKGMPLAWGAKVHTGTGHRDLFFLQAAEGQGAFACSTGPAAFFFRGK